MRRHVWALGHEAHVAQRAGIDDLLEIGASATPSTSPIGGVDQIEQPRKAVAQIEAAPAAVTDVEHPAHLRVELRLDR